MKKYLKRTVILVIILCFSSVAFAQRKSVSVKNSAIIDGIENILVYKFFLPDSELSWSKMFLTKNKFGIDIIFGKTDSINVINSLHSYRNNHRWNNLSQMIDFSPNSTPIGGAFPTIYGKTKYPIYMFYGDSVLNYSILENNRSEWVNNRKLSVMLGTENSIIGILSGVVNQSCVFLNSMNDRQENSVINVSSEDNGFNWERPSIAIKHNIEELKGWCIASKRRVNSNYMILTDKQNQPYYSHSGDGGRTWSYPKKISSVMMGDNYKMSIDNGYIVVFFRCIANADVNKALVGDHNDIMLWHGTLTEFVNGNNKHGNLVKIIDNSIDEQHTMNFSVEDIIYYKNKRYYVLMKNWSENNTSLQLHLIKRN